MKPVSEKFVWICILLVAVTFALYWPVHRYEFVNYDDKHYVAANPHITGGLTAASIKWAFTEAHQSMWHPLTSLSHILDCELFGLNPAWHHFTNVLLHAANILLLLTIVFRMTRLFWPSVAVAVLFAFHPLGVESVAWIAERKNVLSMLFWLLTIAVYFRYTKKATIKRYLLVYVVFAMALMSKPVTVTLPFALLLLDYWPLNRFRLSDDSNARGKFSNGKIILEKIPMLVLSGGVCAITVIFQRDWNVVRSGADMTLDIRLANAAVSYLLYIFKIFYPVKLAVFYPHPYGSLPLWQPLLCLAVLIIITAAVIFFGRRYRYLITGWFWYLGTLVPVIGIIQSGDQAMADRYTYLSAIGIFIILAFGIEDIAARWSWNRYRIPAIAAVSAAVIAMIITARIQLSYWQNSITLFKHTCEVTKDNYMIYTNLGVAYAECGISRQAVEAFEQALRINPNYADAYSNLGVAYGKLGRPYDEIECYKQAIRVRPDYAEAHFNLGNTCFKLGRVDEAIECYKRAVQIKPDFAEALFNLSNAYGRLGRYKEGMEAYKQALAINPAIVQSAK